LRWKKHQHKHDNRKSKIPMRGNNLTRRLEQTTGVFTT
jgi:hypothetical protein